MILNFRLIVPIIVIGMAVPIHALRIIIIHRLRLLACNGAHNRP